MEPTMKKILEASYLTADSASHYRTILRFFYHQHEKMRDYIAPEEILQFMRTIPSFSDYQEDTLHQQLAQLVKWNNLIARQDMTNAKTVEEYKKKRFRYQCTPYTVEIERMLIQLERIGDSFQGSLERSQFERLLEGLNAIQQEIQDGLQRPNEHYMALWKDIIHFFQTIRTSTADYIAYINSEQTDQHMQTEAFLVYKNQFTVYLRDFIISLQKTSLQIQQLLEELSSVNLNGFFQRVIQHRSDVPRVGEDTISAEEWLMEYQEYWSSLRQWFLGSEASQSELDTLQWQTNEMIRRMTRYVQRIGERNQHFRSHKKDYLHLAKWFADCADMEEAHKLSSVVFGSRTVQHLQLEGATTENIHVDPWDDVPAELLIKPRTVRYREKTKPGAMSVNGERKHRQRLEYLQEREQEQQLIEQYIGKGKVQLSSLDKVEPFIRKMFLTWVARAVASRDHQVKTDYGYLVKVELNQERTIILRSEDGDLTMPDAVFFFEEMGEANGKPTIIR